MSIVTLFLRLIFLNLLDNSSTILMKNIINGIVNIKNTRALLLLSGFKYKENITLKNIANIKISPFL